MTTQQIINLFETFTDCRLTVYDPYFLAVADSVETEKSYGLEITGPYGNIQRIEWKTPKLEESFPRALVTTFCVKYRKIDPAQMSRPLTEAECEKGAGHWHKGFCYTKEQMREQLVTRFENLPMTRRIYSTIYPTSYGIGCWIILGCRRDLIAAIAEHLTASGISYSNEFSDARWVYRFRTGLDYPENRALLAALP